LSVVLGISRLSRGSGPGALNWDLLPAGANSYGQLGLGDAVSRGVAEEGGDMGSSLPAVNLGTGLTVTAVTTANRYACALVDGPSFSGRVKCWGERGLAPGSRGSRSSGRGSDG
jgi:hypothetical protein